MEENHEVVHHPKLNNQSQIAGAIVIAGIIIAGAILLRGTYSPAGNPGTGGSVTGNPAKITAKDNVLGDTNAKVAVVVYEDFQCPFCDKFFKETEKNIITDYVNTGAVQFVYRDFAFLGPESKRAAEAARCAGDQGKFWDYHDYLFNHQKGENQGAFADPNLKIFAGAVGLEQANFDKCLDENKYAQAVEDATAEGRSAGVSGTPKAFILKNGKVVNTVNGALPYASVKVMIDSALK